MEKVPLHPGFFFGAGMTAFHLSRPILQMMGDNPLLFRGA
jgi:hypothetical protein